MNFAEYYKDVERLRSFSKSDCMELAYEESLRRSDLVIKDESARRLRLQILLLEDENDDLHEQLAIEDNRVDGLELEREELQSRLEYADAETRKFESELRLQGRELSNVKAELNSMNGLSVDSMKLLTEKLSLARELAIMMPELDHLRKQATYQQTVLAEKLALQRQMATLEVELETEKRALKRTSNKEKEPERDDELQKESDGLRQQLAKEKREKKREQAVLEKRSNELESCNIILENKVDQLMTKLRETKSQLKEIRTESAQAQAEVIKLTTEAQTKNPHKRTAQHISTDSTIGTPDGVALRGRRPGLSRGKPEPTLFGEKSLFSVTPYLNRTISAAPDTPQEEIRVPDAGNKDNSLRKRKSMSISNSPPAHDGVTEVSNEAVHIPLPKSKLKQKVTDRNVLKDAKISTVNSTAGNTKPNLIGILEKVTEEEIEDNGSPVVGNCVRIEVKKPALKTNATFNQEMELKKKKRKLFGATKTLFDEEDGEVARRPAKMTLGPSRPLGKGLAGAKPSAGAFGEFSPLKKDKRGMQASFLS